MNTPSTRTTLSERSESKGSLRAEPSTTAAETAYLFRHALLRDAAYQLQLPGDRARLHGLAFEVIEALAGGRPPTPAPLDQTGGIPFQPHPMDPFAQELSEHARLAQQVWGSMGATMSAARTLYLRRAAEHLERHFQNEASGRLWQQLAGVLTGVAKGEAFRRAGIMSNLAGGKQSAETMFEKAIALHREWQDPPFEGLALASLAQLRKETGRVEQAEQGFERALAVFRDAGNRRHEGVVLGAMATLYRETGRADLAEQFYGLSLAIAREVGRRNLEGTAVGGLAVLYQESGRLQQAEVAYNLALTIHREVGERGNEGKDLGNMAILYKDEGRFEQARRSYEEALAIQREVGDRRSEGIALAGLANFYGDTGQFEKAERGYDAALAIHREVGDRRSEGMALGNRASVYEQTGRFGKAENGIRQALTIHREVRHRSAEGWHLCQYALMLLARKRLGHARENWFKGTAILRAIGNTRGLERVSGEMQRVCSKAGLPPFEESPA
ncbi:MAG: tetratricopeptide repeat protein [Planctomycetes bacterium]|nr:tetratricopeptide repeat protein [Planctomycetota bacterium]